MQTPSQNSGWTDYRQQTLADPFSNYFNFPEFPETITQANHRDLQYVSQAVQEVVATAVDCILADKLLVEEVELTEILDIPSHCLYWIQKFHQPGRKLLWGRPDFHVAGDRPYLLETNFASAAGYQPQVSAMVQYYGSHPEKVAGRLLDPLAAMSQAMGTKMEAGETLLFADIYEQWRHRSPDMTPYSGMIGWLNQYTDLRARLLSSTLVLGAGYWKEREDSKKNDQPLDQGDMTANLVGVVVGQFLTWEF